MPPSAPRLDRNVKTLSFISLLNDVATDMIYPILPLFITQVGGSPRIVGLVEGVAESVASILKLFAGYVSDHFRKRKSLAFLGYLLSNAFRPLYYLAGGWTTIFAVRTLDRVGKGIRTAPRDALIADSTPPELRARAFSMHRAMDNLGALAGPFLATLILAVYGNDLTGMKMVFLWSVVPGCLVIVLFAFVREKVDGTKIASGRFDIRELFRVRQYPRRFKVFAVAVLLFTLGNSSDAFLILRLKEAGVQPAVIPMLWGLLHLVKAAGNYPAGQMADRLGRRRMIVAGWIVYAVVYVLFAATTSLASTVAVFMLYGIYYSLVEGAERAYVADVVPEELRGRAYGVYNFMIGISALPASLLFGVLWDAFSFRVAFAAGACCSIAALVLFVACSRSADRVEPS